MFTYTSIKSKSLKIATEYLLIVRVKIGNFLDSFIM